MAAMRGGDLLRAGHRLGEGIVYGFVTAVGGGALTVYLSGSVGNFRTNTIAEPRQIFTLNWQLVMRKEVCELSF